MVQNYPGKILNFLNETIGPVDVEKIRRNCGIANWNTALKHCLQLLIQGKIKGEETSKGWLFWIHQPTYLQPWEEAAGNFTDLKIDENTITVVLTTQKTLHITFPANTPEAQTIIQTLQKTTKGTKIAILKTDNPQKPLIIRNLNETTKAFNNALPLWWLRKSILCVAFKDLRLIALKFAFALSPFRLRLWLWGCF